MCDSPSESCFQSLKLRQCYVKVCGVLGSMSCYYNVEGLCTAEESCLCSITQSAFWIGCWPVIPLELYPVVGLGRSLVQGSWQWCRYCSILWTIMTPLHLGWWALYAMLASPACCLLFTSCLLHCLNQWLSQNNCVSPGFVWDLVRVYKMLWNRPAWSQIWKKNPSASNWMPVPCNIHFLLMAVLQKTFVS